MSVKIDLHAPCNGTYNCKLLILLKYAEKSLSFQRIISILSVSFSVIICLLTQLHLDMSPSLHVTILEYPISRSAFLDLKNWVWDHLVLWISYICVICDQLLLLSDMTSALSLSQISWDRSQQFRDSTYTVLYSICVEFRTWNNNCGTHVCYIVSCSTSSSLSRASSS